MIHLNTVERVSIGACGAGIEALKLIAVASVRDADSATVITGMAAAIDLFLAVATLAVFAGAYAASPAPLGEPLPRSAQAPTLRRGLAGGGKALGLALGQNSVLHQKNPEIETETVALFSGGSGGEKNMGSKLATSLHAPDGVVLLAQMRRSEETGW